MDGMENESQLLREARKFDETALLKIYDHYAPQVYAHALKHWHDPALADEIVGRVFSDFLEELSTGKGPRNGLQTYFYQSAIDHAKGKKQAGDNVG